MNRKAWEERRKRDKKILSALRKGKSLSEISEIFKLSQHYLRAMARPYGLISTRMTRQKRKEDILKDFRAKKSEKWLSERYGLTYNAICELLRRNLSNYIYPEKRKLYARNQRILSRYKEGASINDLAKRFKRHPMTIRSILIKLNAYKALPGRGRPRRNAS